MLQVWTLVKNNEELMFYCGSGLKGHVVFANQQCSDIYSGEAENWNPLY